MHSSICLFLFITPLTTPLLAKDDGECQKALGEDKPSLQDTVTNEDRHVATLFDVLGQAEAGDKPFSLSEAFRLMIYERNHEECFCKPSMTASSLVGAMDGMNQVIRGLSFGALDRHTQFKRRLGNELAKTGYDPDLVAAMIKRERSRYLRALLQSLRADVDYAKRNIEIHRLLRTVRSSDGADTSDLVAKFRELEEVSIRLAKVRQTKVEIELDTKDERLSGEYLALINELNQLEQNQDRLEHVLRQSLSVVEDHLRTSSAARPGDVEFELLKRWRSREELSSLAQIQLAQLIVAADRLDALEQILEGDLNGLSGPVDEDAIAELVTYLKKNRVFFSGGLFGDGFGEERIAGILDASGEYGSQSFREIREFGRYWRKIWFGRETMIKPRLDFSYAVADLAMLGVRFVSVNNFRAQREHITKTAKSVSDALRSYVGLPRVFGVGVMTRRPSEWQEAASLVALAREAFVNRNVDISPLHAYLMRLQQSGGELHPELSELFASRFAMSYYNQVVAAAASGDRGSPHTSHLVAERILAVQLVAVKRYERIPMELLENIAVWVSGSYLSATAIEALLEAIYF